MLRFAMRTGAAAAAAVALTAGGCVAAVAAVAAPAGARPAAAALAAVPNGTGYSVSGSLSGVAATSGTNAWAVGQTGFGSSGKPLIVHWNGKAWSSQTAPGGAGADLVGVAATSAGNAWAVGDFGFGASVKPLILHWTGKAWIRIRFTAPATTDLTGVAATSLSNAWAVGFYGASAGKYKTLTLHWNGKTWAQVPSPSPVKGTEGAELAAVAATSATNAWAVGSIDSEFDGPTEGLILRWNGKTWQVVSERPAGLAADSFASVAATSSSNAWVVGCSCAGGPDGMVVGHWNGSAWKRMAIPEPALGTSGGVAGTLSTSSAWAIGETCDSACIDGKAPPGGAFLHWNGASWKSEPHSGPVANELSGMAVLSAGDAWAVGISLTGKTLILHWDGASWS